MIRGTTPTLFFKVKNTIDLTSIDDIWVTIEAMYSQRPEKIHLTKTLRNQDVTLDIANKLITVRLTQEETLRFAPPAIYVQLKVLFSDSIDSVTASPIYKVPVGNIINTKMMGAEGEIEEEEDENSSEPEPTPIDPDEPQGGTTE